MFTKRMKVCLFSGVVLGIICIAGAYIRSGFQSDAYFLLALWYNRLLMGLVIGLTGAIPKLTKIVFRGAILGLVVSFAFYFSTGFHDMVSFLAGIAYGIIIEYIAYKYAK